MNENSLLCRLISSCPDWQRVVASKHINYKSEGPYTIFNYDTLNCDFFDSVVQEARGIIIDVPRLEVVCWPFRKFGNYSESYADEIDWSSARVQTKIDGSIVKLWWSKRDGEWVWSTNSCIYAEDASAFDNLTFYDVIRKALDRSPICFDRLNKNHTYMFELVSPDTQVVIYYPAADLWHIGTRDNVSGQELIEDIGIHRPKEYPLRSLSQCIEAANKLNYGLDDVRKEGFVVVDKNWHRIKVKSPEYFVAHKLDTAKPETVKKLILNCLLNNEMALSLCHEPALSYYRYWLEELECQIQACINSAREMYKEVNYDRKAAAELIKQEKFSDCGFKAIDNAEFDASMAICTMTQKKLCNYIPTYRQPTF